MTFNKLKYGKPHFMYLQIGVLKPEYLLTKFTSDIKLKTHRYQMKITSHIHE